MSYVQIPEKTESMARSIEIGSILKQARLQKNISLEEVSKQTFIKLHYLYALEEGYLDQLPAPVYTSGYIRQYARLLNLDEAHLIRQYHEQIGTGRGYNRSGNNTVASGEGNTPVDSQFTPILSQRNGSSQLEEIGLPLSQNMTKKTGVSTVSMNQNQTPIAPQSQISVATSDKRVVDTIEGARKEALTMRHQTEQYADTVLNHVEDEIQKTLTVIRNGRAYLKNRLDSYAKQ
ncbi:hypothetical protein COW36_02670 [bacterium (Candidatus Blackallbacteria) CG17_big_fil_post_rev_8_21_14_2_50_48_46]|uniref:HTH cro/C1-type domain-containing protein n=1 Tax=bacterium (Candidatus Blackallbacteria) CG17_big_fil_post_rev_8_21_14_2_50_48_46 TaxID=2014261 RepID=A0A2M7GA60_9BACT|nr:MAG: hypothetical protein COW64_12800 [bacterium (Candidatus Blackallbacteria) CG18_big_fil_WC_8_21_14_2_50_49_26]PIW19032.1 MAG: hypothetical protein COW36_02670 [bacterium (Candidatus Blackallbacteria) CG17_big_fil_post_rev_8_21_14_2_50_48_46]PIW44600.1 MAG: hypothetical protein COW20_23445 [bacterium (Candidatus Blackallbacteria) CG13_big_fil_rev_8_21_14_2_50_49_14]